MIWDLNFIRPYLVIRPILIAQSPTVVYLLHQHDNYHTVPQLQKYSNKTITLGYFFDRNTQTKILTTYLTSTYNETLKAKLFI